MTDKDSWASIAPENLSIMALVEMMTPKRESRKR